MMKRPRVKKGVNGANDDLKIRVGRYFTDQKVKSSKRHFRVRVRSHRAAKNSLKFSPGERLQKVVVEARPFKNTSEEAFVKHFRYITRKGSGKQKSDPEINLNGEQISKELGVQIVKEWSHDRHHFRFVLSPENGDQIDLKEFTARYVSALEKELNTSLQWVATEHYNTAHPHVHLIVRGKRDDGKDLVIGGAKFFRSGRLIRIGREVATDLIGYRSRKEIIRFQARENNAERFTSLDKVITKKLRELDTNQIDMKKDFRANSPYERHLRRRIQKRLVKLEKLGLARRISRRKYTLQSDFNRELLRLGRRNDILSKVFSERALRTDNVHSLGLDKGGPKRVFGLVQRTGIEDELKNKRFTVIMGLDGGTYHFSIPVKSPSYLAELKKGSLVEVKQADTKLQVKPIDKRIFDYSIASSGVFNLQKYMGYAKQHIKLPPEVSMEDYLGNFTKRLQALQKKNIITRIGATSWLIPDKFISLINEFRFEPSQRINYKLDIISAMSLKEFASYNGLTGLDLLLLNQQIQRRGLQSSPNELVTLLEKRQRFLSDKFSIGIGDDRLLPTEVVSNLYKEGLKTFSREVLQLSDKILSVVSDSPVIGKFVAFHDLPSGRHALIRNDAGIAFIPSIRGMDKLKKGDEVKLEVSRQREPETLLERAIGQTLSFTRLVRERARDRSREVDFNR